MCHRKWVPNGKILQIGWSITLNIIEALKISVEKIRYFKQSKVKFRNRKYIIRNNRCKTIGKYKLEVPIKEFWNDTPNK